MSDGALFAEPVEPIDLWADVVGQRPAIEQLSTAADSPVHAYLLVGPEGSGKRTVAKALAADLLSAGLDEHGVERARRLVAEGNHPSLIVQDPEGAEFSADDAAVIVGGKLTRGGKAEGVVWRRPPEGDRQVVLLPRFVPANVLAFSKLLKAVEEPPASTRFVICATSIPPEMSAIASRCSLVELSPIPESLIVERLVEEGVDSDRAVLAATGSLGSITRARLLARDEGAAARRDAWYLVPERLDGTGATACAVADEIAAGIDQVLEPLAQVQAEQLQALIEQYERVEEQVPKGRLSSMESRHKREQKRVRSDELRSGLATLLSRYRAEVVDGGDAAAFVTAASSVQSLADALAFNPNEGLQLRALFNSLSPLRR